MNILALVFSYIIFTVLFSKFGKPIEVYISKFNLKKLTKFIILAGAMSIWYLLRDYLNLNDILFGVIAGLILAISGTVFNVFK
ncbi:hypothetical protein [Clostridium tunisiense]|uniref:hypothetical protein n=1 Tax=Clostridium tunisiense TaxID=219748 RepID=UPI000310610E|nr:hypothetical protein [Clostridium tunisiense]